MENSKGVCSQSWKGIRWHPLIIRWCPYLRHQSSKVYETFRDSSIALPSQRTIRDYSNAIESGAGFSFEVDCQLVQATNLTTNPDYHRLVILLIDEMHVKEDLVYNKHTGRLIRFVDLDNINNRLSIFEHSMSCESEADDHSPWQSQCWYSWFEVCLQS